MARTSRRGSSKGKGVNVDLSGVEVGSRKVIAEGKYPVSVNAATIETSNNSGNQYIKFELEVTEGKEKGYKLFHNCSLQPQALFNLKSVLIALGFEIPKKAFDLDLKALIGLECIVEVSHELYEGKKRARVTDFINPDEDEGEGEEAGDIEEMLEDLDLDELKELAKELGVKVAKLKKVKDEDSVIELIMEFDEEEIEEAYDELFGDEEDEDDEDDEDEDEDDEDDMDYEDMSLADLKAECRERGLKVKKGMKKPDLIEMLEEDDEE